MAAGRLIGFELSLEDGPAYEVCWMDAWFVGMTVNLLCSPLDLGQPWPRHANRATFTITAALLFSPRQILHTPSDLEGLAQRVHQRLAAVLACQVSRLDVSYRALKAALQAQQAAAMDGEGAAEAALRASAESYFEREAADECSSRQAQAAGDLGSTGSALMLDTRGLPLKRAEPALLQAARAVLRRNREQAGPLLSARAIARILHGVGSPAFPPDAWNKRMGAFWGSQAHVEFAAVLKAAECVVRTEAAASG